jgi:hydrogenase-4 component H
VFDTLRKIWRTGVVTRKTMLADDAPLRFRGKPVIHPQACTGCEACADACPAGALAIQRNLDAAEMTLSYARCIFCGICAEACGDGAIQMTGDYHLAVKSRADLTARLPLPHVREWVAGGGGSVLK